MHKITWKNAPLHYGAITQTVHWLSAITVIGLFAVGWWMVELDYYSEWYNKAPHWHVSVGVLLFFVTVFRIIWLLLTPRTLPLETHSSIEKILSKLMLLMLYFLLMLIMLSGYLMLTAKGEGISVFDWFTLPSLSVLFEDQGDITGFLHEYGAYTLMTLVLLHALAAIKHHFIDKDLTLIRMFK